MVASIFVGVYVEPVAPLILPNEILSVELCHWYEVVPVPFETVAVKVVEPPTHTVAVVGLMDTEGSATTVIVAPADVTVPQPLPV